ncbi:MAG: hypothetical protein V4599_09375 [Verrucomicrobiota bacterium]
MKIALLPITTFAFVTSALSADVPIPGSVANVTFALTLTSSIPGAVAKDDEGKPIKGAAPVYSNEWEVNNTTKKTEDKTYEYVTKMKAVKFGNKELLTELVEREILPKYGTKAPFIAGWTIVVANATTTDEEGDSDQHSSTFYAVHKGEGDIVDLSNYMDYGYGPDYAENGTYREVTKTTGVGGVEASTKTITAAFNWKETLYFAIDFNGFDSGPIVTALEGGFHIMGVSAIGNKLTTVGTPKVPVIVDTAGKISSISGSGPYSDEESERSVVEGSITFAPGKAEANVTGYPNIETSSE